MPHDGLVVGLIVNPIAGIGAEAALHGSDGAAIQAAARARGYRPRAPERVNQALLGCRKYADSLYFVTCGGAMGADHLERFGFRFEIAYAAAEPSSAEDTRRAAQMLAERVDLLVFAGGDGTARDIHTAVTDRVPMLGIPSGVKMHSGVFVTRPEVVGELLGLLLGGEMVAAQVAEIRDVDEEALRAGRVAPRFYGEVRVPAVGTYLTHVKQAGVEREELVVEEIVADTLERLTELEPAAPRLFAPGSTVAAVQAALGLVPTLLGVDAQTPSGYLENCDEQTLHELTAAAPAVLIASFGGGQGVLFGRGNLQLSPRVLRRLDRDRIWLLATRTKLKSLDGRPLLVDSGDADLDRELSGVVEITTGYEDRLLYRVAAGADAAVSN